MFIRGVRIVLCKALGHKDLGARLLGCRVVYTDPAGFGSPAPAAGKDHHRAGPSVAKVFPMAMKHIDDGLVLRAQIVADCGLHGFSETYCSGALKSYKTYTQCILNGVIPKILQTPNLP